MHQEKECPRNDGKNSNSSQKITLKYLYKCFLKPSCGQPKTLGQVVVEARLLPITCPLLPTTQHGVALGLSSCTCLPPLQALSVGSSRQAPCLAHRLPPFTVVVLPLPLFRPCYTLTTCLCPILLLGHRHCLLVSTSSPSSLLTLLPSFSLILATHSSASFVAFHAPMTLFRVLYYFPLICLYCSWFRIC